jgi:predicted TIM-barrel fold metal-dependent hydrolase
VRDSWRCDDERLAYPLYQKCLDLGVDVVQFHKGFPFGNQPLAPLSPLDIERAAIDFPSLRFIIHHLALPYFEEAASMAARHPNIYLALSGNLNMALIAPRLVQTHIGRLLGEVGVHKLLWGSEAALAGCPAPYIKAFLEMDIPEDLRVGYGMPQNNPGR